MKIFAVGTVFFCADRWRDRRTGLKKLIVAFRYFAKAPKKDIIRGITVGPLDVPVLLHYIVSSIYRIKKAKISNRE
jgi:hypothetical protein